jgi:uncharacterized protein YbaP (TraB family)
MHIRDNRVYQFGEKLYPLISSADVFVGEMELERQPELLITNQYDLKEHITASAYDKMRKHFLKSLQIDIERFVHVHPLLAISAISQSLLEAEHQVSLDEHLWHFAKKIGKEMTGLESYEEQVTLLHSLDPVPLYRQLVKISKSPSGISRQAHRALNWYMKSNIHQLYRLTKSSMHGLRKRIIYDRNQVMVKRILEFSPVKTCFIVVGAGHLGGKYGILALLKHSGWKIRPIDILA